MRTRRAGQSALLLLDVIDILNSEGIGYAVIGAMAASVHGVVHEGWKPKRLAERLK